MDIDSPFFQKEFDSSSEDVNPPIPSQSPAYRFVQGRTPALRPGFTQSSSAGDYRSVIDDLTIENKRLKEELKKYKQMDPASLRRDKLFEVKVHGLPSRKRRELEAALRDFTTSLEGSSTGDSPGRKKGKSKDMNSSSGAVSKHASSTSGSHSRPVDSAYASMSGTAASSAPSLSSKAKFAKQRSNSRIQNYLRDIPDGLLPRTPVMSEKDRKKLVVRKLEHLFTGKMGGQKEQSQVQFVPAPIAEDVEMETTATDDKNAIPALEASREARIRPREHRWKGGRSRGAGSASNEHSNGEQTESRDASGSGSGHGGGSGNGNGSGNGGNANTSPQGSAAPEQRPTRPRDLDPDRRQVPSENLDYIRHLGLVAPESQKQYSAKDMSPDAEGWVYLNLLCNLAQLHMLNVTPDFIRSAVSEKSAKFQLSHDGRKIRWRGGEDGTKFSSDSSGRDSRKNQSSDDTDGSNDQDQRKKQKTQASTSNDVLSQDASNLKPQYQTRQDSNSSKSFHYKPLFVHYNASSSDELPSEGDGTGSSCGAEESNLGPISRWGQSGMSGFSQRKRRRDGAIIYYSGAPFCTDLSGDIGGASTDTTYDMTSSSQLPLSLDISRPELFRSPSGSSLPYRPLSGLPSHRATMDLDVPPEPQRLTSGETDGDDDIEANFEWSDSQQHTPLMNLEASGLGGICPEDHFVVVVTTRRPKRPPMHDSSNDDDSVSSERRKVSPRRSQEPADSIANRLAAMTTNSPHPASVRSTARHRIEIEYVTGQTRRLPPVPLPPPAFYYDSSNSDVDDETGYQSDGFISRQATFEEESALTDDDLSGNDEEDEHSSEPPSGSISSDSVEPLPAAAVVGRDRLGGISGLSNMTGSSVATAGGAPSGYNSSMEESA
ncbi:hypothetical protein DL766_010264 [Monosporascus sp. MC13-8B]|nr:hypothetical protein DL766_010264 [Monosporascus sp. MC13-8B]